MAFVMDGCTGPVGQQMAWPAKGEERRVDQQNGIPDVYVWISIEGLTRIPTLPLHHHPTRPDPTGPKSEARALNVLGSMLCLWELTSATVLSGRTIPYTSDGWGIELPFSLP
mmetsp:Transcript_2011/g.3067  ORF Transcript_2011/g.3067 Transcript_2011/m.3067 type:complete len:112 (+) Transcript_2011:2301-2636(+)